MPKKSTPGGGETYRSGLEKVVGGQLSTLKYAFEYESLRIPFVVYETKHYTPDFLLLPNGIVIEAKGRWETHDRKKHRLIKEQYPDLDIRFVFSRSKDRISKQSRTTYARFCEMQGWKYADVTIPVSWLREAPNVKSLACIAQLRNL